MKQKVLLYTERGLNDPNIELFKREYFFRNFEPIAILTPEDQLPNSILQKIPIVLLESTDFDRFLKLGAPRKNLIHWTPRGRLKKFIETRENGETYIACAGLEFHCCNEEQLEDAQIALSHLDRERVNSLTPPEKYEEKISELLEVTTGIEMDWKNPRTFQEKCCWFKLYDVTPLKIRCADKFRVRGYVSEKIGGEYLIPLLGVWEDPDDIDFDSLPDEFVLKVNHGWNMNLIVPDKSRLDFRFAREKLKAWMMSDVGVRGFEFQYSKIPRRIIAEKFMHSLDSKSVFDYKFHCFHGEPKFIQFSSERDPRLNRFKLTMFDLDWNLAPFQRTDYRRHGESEILLRPKNLDKMLELSKKLSADFPFVRVDFYEVDDKIYVGELTFAPAGGFCMYDPPEWNRKLGDWIKLPPSQKRFALF